MEFPGSIQQVQILEEADENNGVNINQVQEIYSARENAYRALWELEEKELMRSEEAPPNSKQEKVWVLTERAEKIIENFRRKT